MNEFCFIVYTNEKYLPIADLTMGEFDKYFSNNPFKKYLISNKFTDYNFINKKAIFMSSDIPFDGIGGQFASVMVDILNKIEEEYIIFFCDDYLLIGEPNLQGLIETFDLIKENGIDFLSFASMRPRPNWEKFDKTIPSNPSRNFYWIPNSYLYNFSVQPCIWKKTALLEILKYNPGLSLHRLDTTNIRNREGYIREMNYSNGEWFPYPKGSQSYGFKCLCTDYLGYDELEKYEYFIFPYIEIMRHGFFNMHQETNTKRFLEKFIEERNLKSNELINKFIV